MIKLFNLSKSLNSFVYTNSLSNANFNNGTTGWGGAASTISASGNILSDIGNGASVIPYLAQNNFAPAILNNKWYHYVKARVTNSDCLSIRMWVFGGNSIKTQNTPIANTWYELSGIYTVPVNGDYSMEVAHEYVDKPTANGKILEITDIIAINLTALFGAGNEPSAVDCVNIFKFINGTKQSNFSKILMV